MESLRSLWYNNTVFRNIEYIVVLRAGSSRGSFYNLTRMSESRAIGPRRSGRKTKGWHSARYGFEESDKEELELSLAKLNRRAEELKLLIAEETASMEALHAAWIARGLSERHGRTSTAEPSPVPVPVAVPRRPTPAPRSRKTSATCGSPGGVVRRLDSRMSISAAEQTSCSFDQPALDGVGAPGTAGVQLQRVSYAPLAPSPAPRTRVEPRLARFSRSSGSRSQERSSSGGRRQERSSSGSRRQQRSSSSGSRRQEHVSGRLNPADLPSRGVAASHLQDDGKWWSGPEFLQERPERWPNKDIIVPQVLPALLQRPHPMTLTSQIQAEQTTCRLHPDNVSSWSNLLRVTAWCKRFLDNTRGRPQQCDSNAGATVQVSLKSAKAVSVPELTVTELQGAERLWISYAQRQCYGEVVSTLKEKKPLPPSAPLTKLQPFLDTDGPPLLRVGGRLRTSHHLSDQFRSRVILPANHRVTQLIVGHEDERCQHGAGTNHLLSNLADRYWIIKGRQVVKSYRHRCVRCQKLWRRVAEPKMGNLPNIRTSGPLQAFAHTGVDYAGPFLVKMGRGRSKEKRYIAAFSCLQTRACHLEVVRSLDVEGMEMALARLCHRRGRRTLILSDNGSNFVATDRELREALRDLDQANITAGLAIQGIRWQFNPPRSPPPLPPPRKPPWPLPPVPPRGRARPHFGGAFERVVGALKKALQSVLHRASLTDEELQTSSWVMSTLQQLWRWRQTQSRRQSTDTIAGKLFSSSSEMFGSGG